MPTHGVTFCTGHSDELKHMFDPVTLVLTSNLQSLVKPRNLLPVV